MKKLNIYKNITKIFGKEIVSVYTKNIIALNRIELNRTENRTTDKGMEKRWMDLFVYVLLKSKC